MLTKQNRKPNSLVMLTHISCPLSTEMCIRIGYLIDYLTFCVQIKQEHTIVCVQKSVFITFHKASWNFTHKVHNKCLVHSIITSSVNKLLSALISVLGQINKFHYNVLRWVALAIVMVNTNITVVRIEALQSRSQYGENYQYLQIISHNESSWEF